MLSAPRCRRASVDLERLIETERRNDDLMRRAAAEAAGVIRAARDAAAARVTAAVDELARVNAAQAVEIAAERLRRLAEIVEAGRADAARYTSVSDPDIVLTARALVDSILIDGGRT